MVDSSTKKTIFIRAILVVIAIFITVFLLKPLDDLKPDFSTWFAFNVLTIFLLAFVEDKVIFYFLEKSDVFQNISTNSLDKLNNDIIRSNFNFFSTSSKGIGLWRSENFLYYLYINGIKSISELTEGPFKVSFSQELKDKEIFFKKGFSLLSKINNNSENTELLDTYHAVRFLIYPEEVYKTFKSEVELLIRIHCLSNIIAFPIVRERLLDNLTDREKNFINDFSKKIMQRIDDEYTLVPRWKKIIQKLWIKEHVYSISIPDCIIVDAFSKPLTNVKKIWWYNNKKNELTSQNDKNFINDAEQYFLIISQVVHEKGNQVLWDNYNSNIFNFVPLLSPSLETEFFEKTYYQKWLDNFVPLNPLLNEWINVEEPKHIIDFIKKGNTKSVLDIGCGWGRHVSEILKTNIDYCAGIDISCTSIKKTNSLYKTYGRKVDFRLENASKLSFEDNRFDLVICMINTFGNMNEKTRCDTIKEIERVLKPGGKLILSVYLDHPTSRNARTESYEKMGLKIIHDPDPSLIRSKEGLYTKAFSTNEIAEYLRNFSNIRTKNIQNIAMIIDANKPE